MNKTKLVVLIAVGVIGYIGWAVMAFQDPSLRPDFLKVHVAAVSGVLALALRDMGPPPSGPSPAVSAA